MSPGPPPTDWREVERADFDEYVQSLRPGYRRDCIGDQDRYYFSQEGGKHFATIMESGEGKVFVDPSILQ